eukprot:461423_1
MTKEDSYDNDINDIQSGHGVEDASEDFKTYSHKDWDELWRKGCVERSKELKYHKSKVLLEKKMKKLEKNWRKESGIKTTSMKSKKKGKTDDKPLENSAQAQKDALTQGADLNKFLQKNQCFSNDLLMVCVQQGIKSEDNLDQIDINSSLDEIYRHVRVLRAQD